MPTSIILHSSSISMKSNKWELSLKLHSKIRKVKQLILQNQLFYDPKVQKIFINYFNITSTIVKISLNGLFIYRRHQVPNQAIQLNSKMMQFQDCKISLVLAKTKISVLIPNVPAILLTLLLNSSPTSY